MLDGSASTDPDGTITSYKWVKIAGPVSLNILKPDSSKTIVKALVAGVYKFELTVADNGGLSAKDTVQVMVNAPGNQPPVACAGADKTVTLPTDTVTLDGSCSADPDNNITSYLWTKIAGSAANITNSNAVQTQVSGLVQGVYQFELKVTDAGGLFSKDTLQVTVIPAVVYTCGDTNRQHINARLTQVGTLSYTYTLATASAGNKIFFGLGDIFDLTTQRWSTAGKPAVSDGHSYPTIVGAENKIFFAGGYASDGSFSSKTVDVYDVSSNKWSVFFLGKPGGDIAAATVGNKVFFAGGNGGFNGRYRDITVDVYDLETNNWTTDTPLLRQLYLPEGKVEGHSATTVNNKIYIAGGFATNGNISDKIYIYDNATNAMSTSSMIEGTAWHAAIAVNNKIYWAGGMKGPSRTDSSCTVEIRDVITGTSSIQQLSRPAVFYIHQGQNAVVKDNKIIFYSSTDSFTFDIYDIPTNTWSIGVFPFPVEQASIISVNNIIYLAGGEVNGVLSNKVYKLDF